MPKKQLTRRDVLRLMALASAGSVAACMRLLGRVETDYAQTPDGNVYLPQVNKSIPPTATPTIAPTSTVIPTTTPNPQGHRVIHVHSGNVLGTGSGSYWTTVDQARCDAMVAEGLKKLTDKSELAQAWRALIPNYAAGQKIAIKVNFNNNETSCSGSSAIDAIIQPVNALVKTLRDHLGVNTADIWVFDAIRKIPTRFGGAGVPGVVFYDNSWNSGCDYTVAGWDDIPIEFSQISVTEHLTDVITRAHYLINMPIMKVHPIAGVSLGFKNHFGTIDDPGSLHNYISTAGAIDKYNPLVDIYRNPHVSRKTVLTVGDGIFGAAGAFNAAPVVWHTFGGFPKSLFFSTDPVAIDSVMADFLIAEKGAAIPANATTYLQLAADAGLGNYDHSDPWNPKYTKIAYLRYDIA